jgi:hypothetical protein
MKVKIAVGDVEVTLSGVDLTPRQVSALVTKAASIAVAITASAPEADPEPRTVAAGFTAHLELDPERNLEPDLSEWFEEAP